MTQPPTLSPVVLPTASSAADALAEAHPQSLDEYFSRDPLEMAREDAQGASNFATIVRELRRMREQWAAAEASGATRAPSARKKKRTDTSLDDLGLEG